MFKQFFLALITFGFVCATVDAAPQHRPEAQRFVQEKWRCTANKCSTLKGFQHCLESQPNYFGAEDGVFQSNPNCIRFFLEKVCNAPGTCQNFNERVHSGDKSRYWELPFFCADSAVQYFQKHEKLSNKEAVSKAQEMIPECAKDLKTYCDQNEPNAAKHCETRPGGAVTLKQFAEGV